MIFGDYPCCGQPLAVKMADKTPCFEREVCPHCGMTVWHYHSRLEPISYTEEGFLREFTVDQATKTIRRKPQGALGTEL